RQRSSNATTPSAPSPAPLSSGRGGGRLRLRRGIAFTEKGTTIMPNTFLRVPAITTRLVERGGGSAMTQTHPTLSQTAGLQFIQPTGCRYLPRRRRVSDG